MPPDETPPTDQPQTSLLYDTRTGLMNLEAEVAQLKNELADLKAKTASATEANNGTLTEASLKLKSLEDRLDANADCQRDVNAQLQAKINGLATTKEAGPMGGRLASAILALASACSGDQQQAIKNILEGVEATPAE